jgi:hypothetical protein
MNMTHDDQEIPAEVTPVTGQEHDAARHLQSLGLKILHIASTISVTAPQTFWETTFGVRFELVQEQTTNTVGRRQKAFPRAMSGTLSIPESLRSLIEDISFVEPPDFFTTD